MPLFERELNQLADRIGRANLTIYLHTAAPSDDDTDNGRVTTGGGLYASGATLTAANISNASDGDISNSAAIAFGAATANIGAVAWWSAFRGTDAVAWGTMPETTINDGDSFTIGVGLLRLNGSTS